MECGNGREGGATLLLGVQKQKSLGSGVIQGHSVHPGKAALVERDRNSVDQLKGIIRLSGGFEGNGEIQAALV